MDLETQIGRVGVLPYVAIGVVAGLFAAMFGIGGGVVIVPLLILITKMPVRMAAATSLATLLLTSLMGVIRYSGSGHIDWVAALVASAVASDEAPAELGAAAVLTVDGPAGLATLLESLANSE